MYCECPSTGDEDYGQPRGCILIGCNSQEFDGNFLVINLYIGFLLFVAQNEHFLLSLLMNIFWLIIVLFFFLIAGNVNTQRE